MPNTETLKCRAAFAALWLSTSVYSQQHPPVAQGAAPALTLPARETLTYGVEWRLIRAGTAKMFWTTSLSGWQGDIHVESAGMVSKLYRVNDDYRVQSDQSLCASNIYITSEEGKRKRETRIAFDRVHNKASYLERDLIANKNVAQKEIDVPGCAHDFFGGLERMRTVRLEPGQSMQLPVSDGKKFANVRVEAQERETIKTPAGTFKCTRYEVHMFNGVLISKNARCFVWISDDAKRLPVQIRVRMHVLVGTITLSLEKEEH